MNLNIRGEKIEITEAMKDYALEKLAKLEKYLNNSSDVTVNVLVKLRNHMQKVEITIFLQSLILRSEEEQEDFYAAIDNSIDKLERQIRKNKTRLESKNRVNKSLSFDFDVDEKEEDQKVVKRKSVEVKPMDEEEAILQLELLGHQFYLYNDIDTGKSAVIYKRKDGNYGIIEAE